MPLERRVIAERHQLSAFLGEGRKDQRPDQATVVKCLSSQSAHFKALPMMSCRYTTLNAGVREW